MLPQDESRRCYIPLNLAPNPFQRASWQKRKKRTKAASAVVAGRQVELRNGATVTSRRALTDEVKEAGH